MSQNIDIKKLGTFVIIGLGILFAFLAGNYVADEDYVALFAVIGGVTAASIFFGLGRRLYLLIPICWGLTGKIGVLPIPFSIAQLVIIASAAYFIADIIFQKKTEKAPFETIDLWIWINLLYLVTVFFRNPVGFAFLGSGDRVGGMPYVNILLATAAYLILSRVRITPDYAKKLPLWIMAVAAFTALAGAVAMFAPQVGITIGMVYSGFRPSSLQYDIKAGETRFEFLTTFGTVLILYVVSQTNPLSLIHVRHLGSLCLYLSGLVMIFLSGFRQAIILSFLYTTLSAFLHGRFIGLVKMAFAVIVLTLVAIFFSFMTTKLPFTAQRALCFLPGNWDPQVVNDAKDSSEWRFEMWEIALTSDKYIHNKIFGDGFGFLRQDYERSLSMMAGYSSLRGDEVRQEMFLLDGDYHSGPVGTIRFVGCVGLVLFLMLLYFVIRMAWRMIDSSQGTEYENVTLFLFIPIIVMPFYFIFVYGDYRTDFVAVLFSAGMLKVLGRSIAESKMA